MCTAAISINSHRKAQSTASTTGYPSSILKQHTDAICGAIDVVPLKYCCLLLLLDRMDMIPVGIALLFCQHVVSPQHPQYLHSTGTL